MRLRLLCLLGLFSFGSLLWAQPYRYNYSVQVGYQLKYLNAKPYNFALDQFNSSRSQLDPALNTAKWVSGPTISLGLHQRRSEVRLQGTLFFHNTFAVGPDSNAVDQRRDVSMSGLALSLGLSSQLIAFSRESYFGVGASFTMAQFNVKSAEVPAASFEKDTPLNEVMNVWKPSFMLYTPFRFGFGSQIKLSIEPYYHVFFSPTNFGPLSEALLGNGAASSEPGLSRELDHPGFNFSLMIFLRP